MKTDKIVIVGGGSAGWMTASALIKAYPEKEIVLIESKDVPIIGVGESTTFEINGFFNFLDLDYSSIMKYTNASYKVAIGFTNFKTKDSKTFYYPFGHPNLDKELTCFGLDDWYYKKAFYPETEDQDYVRYFFPQAKSIETNKIVVDHIEDMNPYQPHRDLALQMDATKLGNWLAEFYAMPRGVKRIWGTVNKIYPSNSGIHSLVLDDGTEVTADLFVDCSGFNSILLGKFINEKFISTAEFLPNNRAWTAHVPYTNKEKELQTFTNCTAINNGWVWNIPLWNRIGSGYVYCNDFISDEDALEEYKQYLDSDQMVVHDPERSKSLTFKNIKIHNGYYDRFWVGNVVAIGLAAGFLEPLESTGLLLTHQNCFTLVDALERGSVTQYDIDNFNYKTKTRIEKMFDFVGMHYALSQRNDTEYWRSVTSKSYPKNYFKSNVEWANNNVDTIKAGFGIRPFYKTYISLLEKMSDANNSDIKNKMEKYFQKRQEAKNVWDSIVDNSKTHFHILKEKFYEEQG